MVDNNTHFTFRSDLQMKIGILYTSGYIIVLQRDNSLNIGLDRLHF